METLNVFTNIPQGLVAVNNVEREDKHVSVSFFKEGQLTITTFAALQLINGSILISEQEEDVTSRNPTRTVKSQFKMLAKLSAFILPQLGITAIEHTIKVDRNDLITLKSFLEARMLHCEKERDARSERFNADTYISMKLLLIDIRELLLGNIDY